MAAAIRLASPEDAAAVVSIYAPYVTDTSVTFEYDVPSVEEYRRRIEEIMQFFPFFLLKRTAYLWDMPMRIFFIREKHISGCAKRRFMLSGITIKRDMRPCFMESCWMR